MKLPCSSYHSSRAKVKIDGELSDARVAGAVVLTEEISGRPCQIYQSMVIGAYQRIEIRHVKDVCAGFAVGADGHTVVKLGDEN
jgi:hypothetical protein